MFTSPISLHLNPQKNQLFRTYKDYKHKFKCDNIVQMSIKTIVKSYLFNCKSKKDLQKVKDFVSEYPHELIDEKNFLEAVEHSDVMQMYNIEPNEKSDSGSDIKLINSNTLGVMVVFLSESKYLDFERNRDSLQDIVSVSIALNSLSVDFFMKYLSLYKYFNLVAKEGVELKQCSRCGEFKALQDFSPSKTGSKGRMSRCKSCINEVRREKRALQKK